MALVDCYAELFAFTGYLLRDLNEKPVSFESAEKNYSFLIKRSEEQATSSGYSEADWLEGLFPVCAWIDESILCSDWPEKTKWERSQLQRRYFQTTNGGVEVFEKLANLAEDAREVREVYAYCLALGFRGGYYQGTGAQLQEISSQNLRALSEEPAPQEFPQELFPDAYEAAFAGRKARRRKWRGFSLFSTFVVLLPIALFVALFFSYDFMLSNEIAAYLGLDVAPLYRAPFFKDRIEGSHEKPHPAPAHQKTQEARIVGVHDKAAHEKDRRHPAAAHYKVKAGDTLASIAAQPQMYGDPMMWPILYRHNLKELAVLHEGAGLPTASLPHGTRLLVATPHEIEVMKKNRAAEPWVINVLSTAIGDKAADAAARLAKGGQVVYLTKARVEGKDWIRVRVGYFRTKADAEKEGERILRSLSLDKIWVAKVGPEEFEKYGGY